MGIIAWIVLGLIAGAIAKALMPGKDPGGIIVTMLIGIVGAFIGGFIGNMITGSGLNGFSLWSIVLAVVGAMLLLWIYRLTTRNPHHDSVTSAAPDDAPHVRTGPRFARLSAKRGPSRDVRRSSAVFIRCRRRLDFSAMKDRIVVRGARQHNLKGFDLEIPRRSLHGRHGPVRLGQVLARLRHDLRRGAAPLRRVAVGVRAAVPRAHGEARRRLDRRALARRRDRAEESDQDVALHGRHRDRDLRLPAPALGARRPHVLPDVRTRAEARHGAVGHRRGARAARRARASTSPFPLQLSTRSRTRSSSRTCARRDSSASRVDGVDQAPRRARRPRTSTSRSRKRAARRRRSARRRRRGARPPRRRASAPRSARATATA